MYACKLLKTTLDLILQELATLFFLKQNLPLSHTLSSSQAGWPVSTGLYLSLFPQYSECKPVPPCPFLKTESGNQTWFFVLAKQTFNWLSPSPMGYLAAFFSFASTSGCEMVLGLQWTVGTVGTAHSYLLFHISSKLEDVSALEKPGKHGFQVPDLPCCREPLISVLFQLKYFEPFFHYYNIEYSLCLTH